MTSSIKSLRRTVRNRIRQFAQRAVAAALVGSATIWCAAGALGATLTWDAGTASGPQDGAGAWNTTATAWWDGTQNIAWDNGAINDAVFGAGSGTAATVTVGTSAITAGRLTFNPAGAGAYTLSSGTITLSGTSSITVATSLATISSVLSGSDGLTKSGTGNLVLTGSNSFSGGTTITSGTLQIGNGGTTGSVVGDIANNSNLTINRSDDLSFGNLIGGTGVLTKAGTNTVTLSAPNGFSGITRVSSGALALGNSLALAQSTLDLNAADSGALAMSGSDATLGGLQGSRNLTIDPGATLSVGNNGTTTTYSGILSGTSGALTKVGGGMLVLMGSATYGGVTTISGGTLQVGAGGTAGWLGGTSGISNNATLVFNRSDNVALAQTVTGSGSVLKAGAGQLTLTATQGYSGPTTISAGTLAMGIANALSSSTNVAVKGSTLAIGNFDATVNGVSLQGGSITGGTGTLTSNTDFDVQSGTATANLAGNVGLNKTTSATVTLAGANSYTGATNITGGVLQFNSGLAIGGTGASVVVASGGVTAAGYVMDQAFVNRIANTAAGVLALTTNGSGSLDFTAAGTSSLGAIGAITYTGSLTPSGSTYRLGGAGGTLTYSGILTNSGGRSLVVNGSGAGGTVILTASNSFSGGTTLTTGLLQLNHNAALGSSSGALTVSGGTLDLNGHSVSIGALSGSGTINNVQAGASSLTVGNGNVSSTFWGTIKNTAGNNLVLAKVGSGALTFMGNTTFFGSPAIAVTGGTLYHAAGTCNLSDVSTNLQIDGGTYNLSGAARLTGAGDQYVGSSLNGSFVQSGGTNSVGGTLNLGHNTGVTGNYALSDPSVLSAHNEYVGDLGIGVFAQSGGTNTVTNLQVPNNVGASGTYNLTGPGRLSVGTEDIAANGGTGRFQQTDGLHTVASLNIGSGGRYVLGGGTLAVTGPLTDAGVFDGSNALGILTISGTAIADFSKTGCLVNVGSTAVTVAAGSLVILPSGSSTSSFGSYGGSGLTYAKGTTLVVPAGMGFGGTGTISDPVNCLGSINACAGGALNLSKGLVLGGTGQINLGAGSTLTANDVVSTISGGSLAVGTLQIGNAGQSTFTHSGGTTSVATKLDVAVIAGGSGTYSLSGPAALLGAHEYIGDSGAGTLTQSDAANTVSAALYLGYNGGARGYYNLGGSGMLSAPEETLGYSGTGTFTQSGGTNTISGGLATLFLGRSTGGKGTYNLNGGLLALPLITIGDGTGAFNLGAGTLAITAASTLSLPITLTDTSAAGTIDTRTFTVTLSGGLTGSGGVTKIGSGTLVLAGTGTFTGDANLNNGKLFAAAAATGSGANSVLGRTDLARNIWINSGTLQCNTSNVFGTAANPAPFLAVNIGSGGVLTNSNYAFTSLGPVNLNGGTIMARNGDASWNAFQFRSAVTSSGASFITATGTSHATVDPNGNTFNVTDGTLTVSAAMTDGFNFLGSFTKAGSGLMVLAGSSSYQGGTIVNSGTLEADVADALPTGGNLTIAGGGHVVLASGLSHAISLGGLTITSGAGAGQTSALDHDAVRPGSLTYGATGAGTELGGAGAPAAPTPEPGTLVLVAVAVLAGLTAQRRAPRRK